MANKPDDIEESPQPEETPPGPLVPIYGGPDIVPGIQAFRRGDIVLYTVRGEPREVQELMSRLDKEQVGEVIALISHHARDEPVAEEEAEAEDTENE